MSKFSTLALILGTFVLLAGFQNCGSQAGGNGGTNAGSSLNNAQTPNNSITVNGTVMQSSLDGCHFLICANDNSDGSQKCFIPSQMDSSLLQAGNQVSVVGVIRGDMVSTCMAGQILQVSSAQLIPQ